MPICRTLCDRDVAVKPPWMGFRRVLQIGIVPPAATTLYQRHCFTKPVLKIGKRMFLELSRVDTEFFQLRGESGGTQPQ